MTLSFAIGDSIRLRRKLLRDLRLMWSQALTIALVVASGIAGFVTSLSAVDSLALARDQFAADARGLSFRQVEAPADAELLSVKNYRAGVFVISNSSPGGVLGQLAFMDLHGLPADFLTHWVASIRAVTPEQVSEMARKFVRPERMTVVVAGDVAKIGASVRALPQFAEARMP